MTDLGTGAWEPYLSVVVASRNDDHGGRLVERTQAFIDGLEEQTKKFNLSTELVIVEWNPPLDRTRMSGLFRWPSKDSRLSVRIIEVPQEIHNRFQHSASLPIFQMIAKNVGIRRARGRFVLATNPDILFTDELIKEVSNWGLSDDSYYRAERDDIPTNVLEQRTSQERLDYGRTHILRAWKRWESIDYVRGTRTQTYHDERSLKGLHLLLWGAGLVLILDFLDRRYGGVLDEIYSRWEHRPRRVRRKKGPSLGIGFGVAWKQIRKRYLSVGTRFRPVGLLRWVDVAATNVGRLGIRVRSLVLGMLSLLKPEGRVRIGGKSEVASRMVGIFRDAVALPPPKFPKLFYEGCGDFTLMSKSNWSRLRGYPEIPAFSLHIDSLLLSLAHYSGLAETVFDATCFHVEHSRGWIAEGGESKPYADLHQKGVPILTTEDFYRLTGAMIKGGHLVLTNPWNWGLGDQILPETNPLNLSKVITPSII